jgi:CheY-like chemotaxis protein
MPQMNGFELAEEIKRIDKNIKMGFLIAGEVPGNFELTNLEQKNIRTSLSNYQLKITIS